MWWKHKNPALKPFGKAGFSMGFVALGLSGLLLTSCETQNLSQAEQENVTSEDVAGDAAALVGQEITVRNVVSDVVGNESFTIDAGTGEPVLVVNATGQPFQLPGADIPIQTTGTVEQFAADTLEQQYGVVLDRELYADYEGQPAIIAESLALAPNPEDFYEAAPGTYTNQPVAIEGDVRLLEETTNAFALFEEGWTDDVGVLVIGVEPFLQGETLDEGENIVVTGEAQPASEQLLREANPGWSDAQIQEFISRYTDRPLIVADGVYPSAVDPAPGG